MIRPWVLPPLLLLLGLLVPRESAAFPKDICSASSIEKKHPGSRLFSTLIPAVRFELRQNVLVIDRLLACIRNDQSWFDDHYPIAGRNGKSARDFAQCDLRLKNLGDQLQETFPKMRMNLALASFDGVEGDSRAPDHPTQLNELKPTIERFYKNHATNRDRYMVGAMISVQIAHAFSGLASLEPLSDSEIAEALKQLNEESDKILNQSSAAERESSFDEFRANQKQLYLKLITNSPILGMIRSARPSSNELEGALLKMREHLEKELAEIKERFYQADDSVRSINDTDLTSWWFRSRFDSLALYTRSLRRITSLDQTLCPGIQNWGREIESRQSIRDFTLLGVIIGGSIACEVSRFGLMLKSGCRVVFGLGANAYFLGTAMSEYDQAFDLIFSGPYGFGALSEIDNLTDAEFSRTLAWLALPIGTGIPITRALRPSTLRQLWNFKRAKNGATDGA